MIIPTSSLEEKPRLCSTITRKMKVFAAIESAVEMGLVRVGRLRQFVLRSAFEGRL